MKIDEKLLDKCIFLALRALFSLSGGVVGLIICNIILDMIAN